MSEASSSVMTTRSHPSIVDRAAVWASWLLAGAIFLTIGWLAMAPDDPQGAVSILTRRHAPLMLLQACALAGITAALATVIAGRQLPHVGTFAAAIGLAAVSLRGESAVYLLLQRADSASATHADLAGKLAFEAILWFAILGLAALVTEFVSGWLKWPRPKPDVRRGWQHAIVAGGAGLAVFYLLGGGVTSRAIAHGQACFLVAATVFLSGYLAHRLAPVRSPHAAMVAVGALAVIGFGLARLIRGAAGLPANVPASPFLRVLPIQFISVGFASAIATYWYMSSRAADTSPRDETIERNHEDDR